MPEARADSWFRRAPGWLRILLACLAPYCLWLASVPSPGALNRLVEIGFLALLQALTMANLWRAARRPDLPAGYAASFRLMAAFFAMSVLAALTFPIHAASVMPDVNLGVADLFYVAGYPLVYLGLLRLPKAPPPLPSLGRILLDSAAFAVGVGLPLWIFAIQPILAKAPGLVSILSILYPALALGGVMVLNTVLLRAAPFPNRGALYLLTTGIGLSWLSDMLFALEISQSMVQGLRYWVNISNAVSLGFSLLGSWRLSSDPAPARLSRPSTVSPIPMLTIVFVSMALARLLVAGSLDGPLVQKVVAGGLPLIVVLLLRETLAMRETRQLAAEAAAAHLQARFEALVRHSSDLILVVDPEGTIRFASPASARILGEDADSLGGQNLLPRLHPEDQAPMASFLRDLGQAEDVQSRRCRIGRQDGAWRLLDVLGSNLLGDAAVRGLVLNARDISERHQLEDQLMEAQKMEAVGRLAGGVAHDFNNLLSAILGNLELAEMALEEGHPAQRELKRIHGAASRGAVLTGRLLAFVRKDSPESRTVDPGPLVLDMKPLLEGLLGEQVRLVFDFGPEVWPITLDPSELEQALLNLAANARDAMPDGGTLTLRLRNQTLKEGRSSPYLPLPAGDLVFLEVLDTGTGMPEATLQHLFEPFFTTKRRGKGTGLGLASVYGFVKASQGGLAVYSIPGRGTMMQLAFPRALKPVPEAAEPPEGAAVGRGHETVLLVEDEAAVRETTEEILAAHGYRVFTAPDAAEARQVFAAHAREIDLLLTDVIMPGDSGPALAADLVAAHPGLRVLYVSGYTADELGPHGLARPDAPLLRKPFSVDQLTRRLRAVLQGPPGQL